eukprot:4202480-Amphidinium_carterae.1
MLIIGGFVWQRPVLFDVVLTIWIRMDMSAHQGIPGYIHGKSPSMYQTTHPTKQPCERDTKRMPDTNKLNKYPKDVP